MTQDEIIAFCLRDNGELFLECALEAEERGLPRPTAEEKRERELWALSYMAKHGNAIQRQQAAEMAAERVKAKHEGTGR